MQRKTAILFGLEAILLSGVIFLLTPLSGAVLSAVDNIVISEVQISGVTTDDEFVELYNPTNNPVDLTGWRLARRTANATTDTNNLVASMSGTIPAHGYFLIAHPDYSGPVEKDLEYSATSSALAANNAVLLYRDEDGIETLEDKVGLGTSINAETQSVDNPASSGSVERKALQTSTLESMTTGTDILLGNGEDTDNNFNDFVVRNASDPQNSSVVENLINETASPSPTPIESSSPTPSPTPTESPSPTPTIEPTSTPQPSPTPTIEPTSSPEVTPTPSPTLGPTATPSQTVEPTPTPSSRVLGTFRFPRATCRIVDSYISFGFMKFRSPKIECEFI